MEHKKIKAIVIGATGAVGRQLVDELLKSPEYELITVFVRRTIDRWEKLKPEEKEKLKIEKEEDLNFLGNNKEELSKKLKGINYDVLFNCLGSRVGRGEEEFRKVDYTYVVQSCEVCEKMGIPHFSLCSSGRANKDSWFLFMRVKGDSEEEIKKKAVQYKTIIKPGVLLNRDNDDRLGEGVASYIPFIDKIDVKDVAKAMMLDDLHFQNTKSKNQETSLINNSQIFDMIKRYNNELQK